jgi:hypothetical protein
VLVDGKPRGTTPLRRLRLPAGTHRVTLVNDELGYRKSFPVAVKPGRTASVSKVIEQ